MASTGKRNRSPFWWIWYRDPNGKQHTINSGLLLIGATDAETAANARLAETMAARVQANVDAGLPPDAKPAIAAGAPSTIPTFAAYAAQVAQRASGSSKYKAKLARYVQTTSDFLGVLATSAPISNLTPADFAPLSQTLSKTGASDTSVTMQVQFVRSVFTSAVNEGLAQVNPVSTSMYRSSAGTRVLPQSLTDGEVQAILNATHCADNVTAILFGYYAAMDVVAACRRTYADVDFTSNTIVFAHNHYAGRVSTLTLPLHPVLLNHLVARKAAATSNLITPLLAGLCDARLTHRFASLFEAAGLKSTQVVTTNKGKVRSLQFRSLRLALATRLGLKTLHRLSRAIRTENPDRLRDLIHAMPALTVPVLPILEKP